ncbi:uncharacterized protein ACRADG_010520 [Cochliomyia hominivorax]
MSSPSIWLLRFAQFYGIICGFTYIFIDTKTKEVKISLKVKSYTYFVNFLYVFSMTYFHVYNLINYPIYNDDFSVLFYAFSVEHFLRLFILFALILLRIREERALKKWIKIIQFLQAKYFDEITPITTDKVIKRILSFNIFNIISHSVCSVLIVFLYINNCKNFTVINTTFYNNYFIAMEHYVMLHHGLLLWYLNNCFLKFNYQLQEKKLHRHVATIYSRLSLILQDVNALNGTVIFLVIVSLLLAISLYAYITIIYDLGIQLFDYDTIFDFCIVIIFCIDIFLYFLICERVQNTTKETGRILMEYTTREYQKEIEIMALERLTNELCIDMSGFVTLNLGSLFSIISEIVMLTIILLQIDYNSLKYESNQTQTTDESPIVIKKIWEL